jgi:hypothetical protein
MLLGRRWGWLGYLMKGPRSDLDLAQSTFRRFDVSTLPGYLPNHFTMGSIMGILIRLGVGLMGPVGAGAVITVG